MKTRLVLTMLAAIGLAATSSIRAADFAFTNVFGGDFLNPFNWSPNGVPGAADNANFDNPIFPVVTWAGSRTNANARANGTTGGFQANIGTNFWLLTNSFVLGETAGRTGSVIHLSGELRVTNSAGTARLVVGQNGRGAYILNTPAASVVADLLFATNNSPTLTNSTLLLSAGTLTTLRGAVITQAQDLVIGALSNATATWNMFGGTNRTGLAGVAAISLGHAAGATGVVSVTGVSTMWSNAPVLFVGNGGVGRLLVTNGARVHSVDASVGHETRFSLATLTGPNTTWTCSATLKAGDGLAASNRLEILNGASVTSLNGTIGENTSSTDTTVLVSGPGSRWIVSSNLLLGMRGDRNLLIISNQASVSSATAMIGAEDVSSNNTAFVTGPGSTWTNMGTLTIGGSGAANSLILSNGGTVAADSLILSADSGSSNSLLRVTGANSQFLLPNGTLDIGLDGSGGQMIIEAGGFVSNTFSAELGDGPTSQNNSALVRGAGTRWDMASILRVGDNGSANSVIISNGATVSTRGVVLGESPGSINNILTVADGNLFVTNASLNASLDIRRGTNFLNSGMIEVDGLLVTNSSGRFEFNGGTLITRGATIFNNSEFTVGGSNGLPAFWNVRAGVIPHSLASNLYVGRDSAFNQLMITNGAALTNNGASVIGLNAGSISNLALIAGSGSRWTMAGVLNLGNTGYGNRLVVSNGAYLENSFGNFGAGSAPGSNNVATISGSGSVWSNRSSLRFFGSGNRLVVSNAATLMNDSGEIGVNVGSVRNEVLVTGSGSQWKNFGGLYVGEAGAENQLLIRDSGTVLAGNLVLVGGASSSTNCRIVLDGGTLRVTNAAHSAAFDLRRGTNVLNAGLIEADILLVTNVLGEFEFKDGTLLTRSTTNSNGRQFVVGVNNGAAPAILQFVGSGTHFFGNGLSIANSGFLTGNGTIIGGVTVQTLGTLSPGTSVGKLVLSNSPALQGRTVMEISKNGAVLTNDQIQIAGPLTYGGSLIVSNLGPTAPAAGDGFQLFIAGSYGGAFNSLILPSLNGGLTWSNRLLIDGSIQVVPIVPPVIDNIAGSGSNVVIVGGGGTPNGNYRVLTSTNIALPLTNWSILFMGRYDCSGNFSFTDFIGPTDSRRFYVVNDLLSTPRATVSLVSDTWWDGERAQPVPPAFSDNGFNGDADPDVESAWFSSPSGAMQVQVGLLSTTQLSGSSSSYTTYFTPELNPVTLANAGEQLKITWVFTPLVLNSNSTSQGFRIAVVDSPATNRVTADFAPQVGPYLGYALFMNMRFGNLGNANSFQLRKRAAPGTPASFLVTGSDWTSLTNAATTATPGYTGDTCTNMWTITRNASNGLEISCAMQETALGGPGTNQLSLSYTDATPQTFTFDTFGIRPTSMDDTAMFFWTTLFKVEFTCGGGP